ncbi:MAG: ROK family protein [bacterium]
MLGERGKRFAIGIDLGGTNIKMGVVDDRGKILETLHRPTEEEKGGESLIRKLIDASQELISRSGLDVDEFLAIGMGSPGFIDAERGVVADCPGKIPGWTGMDIRGRLGGALGLPLFVDNDVKVIALGEGWMGAGRGSSNFACIALGTGVGGGILIDGRIYQGSFHGSATLGHIIVNPQGPRCLCGNYGCLECYASGPAIAASAIDHIMRGAESSIEDMVGGDISKVTAEIVFKAAEDGDEVALEIVNRAAQYLAVAIITIFHTLDPEMVILGGKVAKSERLLVEPVREMVRRRVWAVPGKEIKIVPSQLGDDAGILGAAALAFLGVKGNLNNL